MLHIIYLYFIANAFLAGHFGKEFEANWRGYAVALLFAVPLLIGSGIRWCLLKVDRVFQVRFYWSFFITRRHEIPKGDSLDNINRACKLYHHSRSLRDRIWRWYVSKINQRHNYIPSAPQS